MSVEHARLIEVHIERLVLEGLSLGAGDAMRLQVALEAELERSLSELQPELVRSGAAETAHGPAIEVTQGARPAELGSRIAQSVSQAVSQSLSQAIMTEPSA